MTEQEFDLGFMPASYWPGDEYPESAVGNVLYFKRYRRIATVYVASVLGDEWHIYAHRSGNQIRYRVTDGVGIAFPLQLTSLNKVLSLGELISAIDTTSYPFNESSHSGLLESLWEGMAEEGDLRKAARFATIYSDAYPQLADYYERRSRKWCIGKLLAIRHARNIERAAERERQQKLAPYRVAIRALFDAVVATWPAPTGAVEGMGRGYRMQKLMRDIEAHVLKHGCIPFKLLGKGRTTSPKPRHFIDFSQARVKPLLTPTGRQKCFSAVFKPTGSSGKRWRISGSGVCGLPMEAPLTATVVDALKANGIKVREFSMGSPVNVDSYHLEANFLDGGLRADTGRYMYSEKGAYITGRLAIEWVAEILDLRLTARNYSPIITKGAVRG